MIRLDCFGRPEYVMQTARGEFVVERKKSGPYRIYLDTYCRRSDPVLIVGCGWWFDVPVFDSFIKAVKFLKENINDLY